MEVADGHLLVGMDHPPLNPANGDAPHILVVVDGGDQHLEGRVRLPLRRGDVLQNGVEQGLEVFGLLTRVQRGGSLSGGAVDKGAVQLFVGGVELHKQLQHLVLYFIGAGVGAVHLVDHHNDLVPQLQGFLQYKAGLGHGALKGVHQQQNPVYHLEHPLHLSTEVGVAGGVDDVNLYILIIGSGVFGQDCDAPLPFQGVGVHHPVLHHLVLPERAALLEQLVYKGGLSVVNVGDDGDISQIISYQV